MADVDSQREWRLADESLLLPDRTPTAAADPAPGALHNGVAYVLNGLLDLLFSPAHAADLVASSANPSVFLNDTSTTHGDWRLLGLGSGTTGNFRIVDYLGNGGPGGNNHTVIRINGTKGSTANENSIVIDSDGDIDFADGLMILDASSFTAEIGSIFMNYFGNYVEIGLLFVDSGNKRVGIGTSVPANDLHITSSSPTIRLDDVDGRIWEINWNSNSEVFDIRDLGAGISPLRIFGGTGRVELTGPFAVGSSRDIKHGFATVEPREVLERLLKLEVSQWSYNSEDASVRHMGPVAEDFGALFALGPDDKHVSPADMSGVAFAAIQGLHQIVREREAGIADLRQSHGKLNEQVESRDAEIDTLRKSQAKLKEQVSSRDAEISELRQSRDDLAARIEALEKLVSSGMYVTSATNH